MGIFDTLFGKTKTGSHYQKPGVKSFHQDDSFRTALRKLRLRQYGGDAGQNLSADEADKIADVIEPHLKNLPPGGKLSIGTKQNIRAKLWQMVKAGEISELDFADAKNILEQF